MFSEIEKREMRFKTIEEMIYSASEMIEPPANVKVSESAAMHRKLNNKGSYIGMWPNEKTPYLVEPMNTLQSMKFKGMVFVGPARTGKALAINTPINTPTGWKTMADLAVGDTVFDENGSPCKIVAATPVMRGRPCVAVTFSDHETIVCDEDHMWSVYDAHKPGRRVTMATADLHPTHIYGKTNRNRYSVDVALPIKYEQRLFDLDPYILGVWLGDGHNIGARLSSGALDVDNMVRNIEELGVKTRVGPDNGNNFVIYLSEKRHNPGRSGGSEGVSKHLRSYGMCLSGSIKYIPDDYLRASVDQRRALLAGLMDTDGHVDTRGQCEFCTTSPYLAEGFAELITSLGYKFCLTKRPAANKTAYRLMFYVKNGDIVFRLDRKQARLDASKQRKILNAARRSIVSMVRVDTVPVRCIQVDSPSRLYLAGRKMVPTHNSDMFFNWLTHTAIYDPLDMMFVAMTQNVARDWSIKDLSRMLRTSKDVGAKVLKQNVFDVMFANGMQLLVKWPSISELSGKTMGRGWFADYDRLDDDIDGEGGAYDLGFKRGETLGNNAMWVAESSPGKEITEPNYLLPTPHHAPPTKGILALYNRGDRRRWYWRCLNSHCRKPFEPKFECLNYPDTRDISEAAEMVTMRCPHCSFDMGPELKEELNSVDKAKWIKDGEIWLPNGSVAGRGPQTDIASFWMFGPSAAFNSWGFLVTKYLEAQRDFAATGDMGPLKVAVNTNNGEPFLPPTMKQQRSPEWLEQRKRDWGGTAAMPVVPPGVRFLIATVDVQAGQRSSFVVQVHGFHKNMDVSFVDMFKIEKSLKRKDEMNEHAILDPAGYPEDWHALISQVIMRTYPLSDESGRRMAIRYTGCDMGGAAGVAANAYQFWRHLRDNAGNGLPVDIAERFTLLRGNQNRSAPRVMVTMPDARRKDQFAIARGDVPVLALNSNMLKDQISAMLNRTEEGGGYISFPHWTERYIYMQLTAERRTDKGWENTTQRHNEAWDLLYYAVGLVLSPEIEYSDIDWRDPPDWAREWEENSLVFSATQSMPFEMQKKESYDLGEIASQFG